MIKKNRVSKILPLLLTLNLAFLSFLETTEASVILKGQVVKIGILGVPEKDKGNISASYNVNDSGTIRLWQLGSVKAAGLTSDQLARHIEDAYKESQIFTSPSVQVVSNTGEIEVVKKTVTVGGDVRNKGILPFAREMTLYQAVTSAGGANEFGAINRVELIRNRTLHVYDLRRDDHKLLRIYPGDTITIPRKDWKGQ